MGFNLMLRRATPSGTRTVAVPTATTFEKTVTISIRAHNLSGGTSNIIPTASRRFSSETAKKQDILRAFFNAEPQKGHDGSPFKVVDISSEERDIIYAKDYKGEYTIVHFYNFKESDDQLEKSGDELEKSGDELEKSGDQLEKSGDELEKSGDELEKSGDELEKSGDELEKSGDELEKSGHQLEKSGDELENSKWCGEKLSMYVVKPNGWLLEFGGRVFKGEAAYDDLILTNTETGDEFVYSVNDLDWYLESAYMKFQSVRDIDNPAAVGFDVSIFH